MVTKKEIQKAQRILDETIETLNGNLKCEVFGYDRKGYRVRFFTKGSKLTGGVSFNIPEEWIDDTSPIDNNIREELGRLLRELEREPKREKLEQIESERSRPGRKGWIDRKMRKQTFYFGPTLAVSILFGILPPLVLGVDDLMLIATTFSMVWLLYAIILLVSVFLIKPGLKIKACRKNGVTVVRYELLNPGKKR